PGEGIISQSSKNFVVWSVIFGGLALIFGGGALVYVLGIWTPALIALIVAAVVVFSTYLFAGIYILSRSRGRSSAFAVAEGLTVIFGLLMIGIVLELVVLAG
ncbi:MAG: hypothetical protein ABEI06_00630, partial [Halobacteriaceae archaeon]